MTKRYWLSWCWQLGIAGFLGWLGVSAFASQTLAQSNIVPDNTLGAESSVVIDNFQGLPIEIITGGATRGVNLFHSFREFNVSEGRGAFFFSPDASIQNILARVTGSNRSEILGILGVLSSSAPNLFLINPNGIVFGEKASLNVAGSFVATSANGLKLGDVGLFSASQPATSNLLTVNPSALLFNAIANQEIVNRSTTGLQVPEGRSLLLVGGKVNLDKGVVQAPGGRVELGGVSGSGTISLNVDGNNLSLNFPENVAKADVSLNQANIDVSGVGGGSVQVQGDRVTFNTGSSINSYTIGNQNSGDIFIRASQLEFTGNSAISAITNGVGKGADITIKTGSLTLQDNSAIFTGSLFAAGRAGDVTIEATDFVNLNQSRFGTLSLGTGDGTTTGAGGNISIKTQNFSLNNLSGIVVSTFFGKGNAGNLSIQATNSLNLDNSAFSTSSFGAGTGGDIFIDTKNLRLQNLSNIFTSTLDPRNADISSIFQSLDPQIFDPNLLSLINTLISSINPENVGKVNSGNVIINASDSVEITGGFNVSAIFTGTLSAGNGGNVTITTGNLRVQNGGLISTGTDPGSQGKGGNLIINASDAVEIRGITADGVSNSGLSTQTKDSGNAGDLQINTKRLIVRDEGIVSATTSGSGKGGNLTINALDFVEVSGESPNPQTFTSVTTGTAASGDAGNLKINTGQLRILNNSSVYSGTFVDSQGKGGNLIVTASDAVQLTNKSSLSTQTLGFGSAGDLTLETGRLIIQDEAYISAATLAQGTGGNIQINANLVSLNNQASITGRSQGTGLAGDININIRDSLQANNSNITTSAIQAGGGDISVTAKNIRLRNNSDIRTNLSSGQESGGNIFLSANTIIALEDSDILAFAPQGKGGNITFNTRAFLSNPLYRPTQTTSDATTLQALDGNNRVDVNATGAVTSGNIVGIPDITFLQNSLNELPQNLIDANALIANSCIARRNNPQQGTFLITGSGGLPERPGDAPLSSFPTTGVQNVPKDAESATSRRPWKIGDPIVEPQGVYRLANGQRVLSRECP